MGNSVISQRVRTRGPLIIALAISWACGGGRQASEVCTAVEMLDVAEVTRLLDAGGVDLTANQRVSGMGCRPFPAAIAQVPPERLTEDRRPFEIVKLMLDRGADPNSCWVMRGANPSRRGRVPSDSRDHCALELAADQQSPELVRLLLARGANAKGGVGGVALVSAAEAGDLELVKVLLEAGAPVNEVAPSTGDHGNDRTALGAAVQFFNDEVVAYLETIPEAREFPVPGASAAVGSALSRALGTSGWLNANEQAFMSAARKGDVAALKGALAAGVAVDRVDEVGNTALMRAAGWGQTSAVDVLLAARASLAPMRDGETALHLAAKRGHVAAIRSLVAAKADVNMRAHDNSDTPLLSAVKGGRPAAVRTLVDLGADPNVSESSMTALEYAVWRADAAVVRELLKNGRAAVNSRHASAKESPLHGALWCKNRDDNVELIQTLVDAGADLTATNQEGDSPLQAVEKKRLKETIPYYQTCYDAQIQVLRASGQKR
jgi:ankyrin repeat protein